jgi:hypothetical protein
MPGKISVAALAIASTLALAPLHADENECQGDDFTTAVIADYVLACMSANGNSFQSLHQCSCSIDLIKSRLTYQEYEEAQTIMQAQRDLGQRGVFYRDSSWAKKRVELLEKVQGESTLRCF